MVIRPRKVFFVFDSTSIGPSLIHVTLNMREEVSVTRFNIVMSVEHLL